MVTGALSVTNAFKSCFMNNLNLSGDLKVPHITEYLKRSSSGKGISSPIKS